jgi:hypothetical protein
MSAPEQATTREMRWIGIIAAAIGCYFSLVGLAVLPVPGGPGNLHAPLCIVLLIGLMFLLAGAAALMQSFGRADAAGELPADAPRWMRAAQYLFGVALFAAFAMLGSWVAIGGDARHFSGGIPFLGGALNVSLARIVFGFGALICWLAAIGFAVSGARKLLRDGKANV